MPQPDTSGMREYWNERARQNAVWYVDTSIDYENPDMDRFFETGRTVVSEALDGAPVLPPGRGLAVEIGSGLGRICIALADRFDQVIGIDISAEMLERSRKLVTDPRVEFRLGDGASLQPLADGCADLVLSFTVFQHIPDVEVIQSYVAEAGRILKPGGVFVFQWNSTPGAWRWSMRRTVLAGLQRRGLKAERYERHAKEFLGSRVPIARMREGLSRVGLELRATRNDDTLYTWAWARKG